MRTKILMIALEADEEGKIYTDVRSSPEFFGNNEEIQEPVESFINKVIEVLSDRSVIYDA